MAPALERGALGLEERATVKAVRGQFEGANFAAGIETGETQTGRLEFFAVEGVYPEAAMIALLGRSIPEEGGQSGSRQEGDLAALPASESAGQSGDYQVVGAWVGFGVVRFADQGDM